MARWMIFDLGGVLVRIWHDWAEVARAVGLKAESLALAACPLLSRYQSGDWDDDGYLAALAARHGCSQSDAQKLHLAILAGEYPGVDRFVQQVKAAGWRVGCLSNTNALHWAVLRDPANYPTVAGLDLHIASHEIGANKPDPAAFAAVEAATGASGHDIVFIDDTRTHVDAARERGWQCYQVQPAQALADLYCVWAQTHR